MFLRKLGAIDHGVDYVNGAMHQIIKNWSQAHRSPQQNPNEHITDPEDVRQTDLVPDLSPSGGFENIVTGMDVFSRC